MYFGKSSCRTPPGGGGVGSDYKDISKITGNLKDISPMALSVVIGFEGLSIISEPSYERNITHF